VEERARAVLLGERRALPGDEPRRRRHW
jgi:hypothetical protein